MGQERIESWLRQRSAEAPISVKESRKWLVGLAQAQQVVAAGQELLVVGDRESDVYALFVAPRRAGVELLVRLAQNRVVVDDEYGYVRDALAPASIVGTYEVAIPRQGSRPKRLAKLDVRIARVSLRAPGNSRVDGAQSVVEVSLVWAA